MDGGGDAKEGGGSRGRVPRATPTAEAWRVLRVSRPEGPRRRGIPRRRRPSKAALLSGPLALRGLLLAKSARTQCSAPRSGQGKYGGVGGYYGGWGWWGMFNSRTRGGGEFNRRGATPFRKGFALHPPTHTGRHLPRRQYPPPNHPYPNPSTPLLNSGGRRQGHP